MSTTNPSAPNVPATPAPTAPVADVEQKVEEAAPTAAQPEVAQIESEFNTAVEDAAAKAPAEEAKAAEKDPGVEAAAKDAAAIASGKAVPATVLAKDASVVYKEVRRGFKTTEFWVAAAVIVLTQVGAFHIPGKYGDTITTSAAAAAYIISRGLAK